MENNGKIDSFLDELLPESGAVNLLAATPAKFGPFCVFLWSVKLYHKYAILGQQSS